MDRGFDGYPGPSNMGGMEDDEDEYQEVMMKRSICYLVCSLQNLLLRTKRGTMVSSIARSLRRNVSMLVII